MRAKSFGLVALLFFWSVPAFALEEPPEGVWQFTAGTLGDFVWQPTPGTDWEWYEANTGSRVTMNPITRETYVRNSLSQVIFSFTTPPDTSLIRSSAWDENGQSISSVLNQDGSTWTDPLTGQPWGVSGSQSASSMLFDVEALMSGLLMYLPIIVAGCVGLGFGLGLVRCARGVWGSSVGSCESRDCFAEEDPWDRAAYSARRSAAWGDRPEDIRRTVGLRR